MASIIGGIATSHSPTIGFALDHEKQHDPAWAPIFAAYEPVRRYLAEQRPDVLLIIYNDHGTSFFFDHYSLFALGIGESYAVADEGGGARALPALKGHSQLAQHVGTALVAEEFDLSFFQDRPLDHGCFSPLSLLWPHQRDGLADWPGRVVPLQVGAVQFPLPSARRCYKLGQALRRALESYEEDLRVVVVGTGGLSHQVHGERAGFNNTEWDAQFLELIEKDPERLTAMTHADFARLGGLESAEVVMWLIMRGALSANVKKVHQSYYLPTMTGLATAIYENEAMNESAETHAAYRAQIHEQVAGIEQLPGTYPFTLARSVKAYRLNKFLHRLIEPMFRQRFLAEPATLFREHQLTDEEAAMIERRDWRALIHYGASFFLLEKLGAVVGVPNLHIYAAMRGESLEDFLKTRNAPSAVYSVAAKPKAES